MVEDYQNELTNNEIKDVTGFPHLSGEDLAMIQRIYGAQESMRSYEGNVSFLNKLMNEVDGKNYLRERDEKIKAQEAQSRRTSSDDAKSKGLHDELDSMLDRLYANMEEEISAGVEAFMK